METSGAMDGDVGDALQGESTKGTVGVSPERLWRCAQQFTSIQWRVQEWLPDRDAYLGILLALEGNPALASGDTCSTLDCSNAAEFRCLSCIGGLVMCSRCIVDAHQYNPFHQIQVSNIFLFFTSAIY